MTILERLRERMKSYAVTDTVTDDLTEAAVLVPFVDQPEPELILTVRSRFMPTHAGEVAFPGGKRDPGDTDLLDTALRESHEEVGLARDQVEVVGQLSPLPSRFGLKVTPFVGVVPEGVALVADPGELQSIFRVPVRFFFETAPNLSAPREVHGRRMRMPSYHFEGNRIWGLTAFMILDVLNHVYDTRVCYDLTGENRQ